MAPADSSFQRGAQTQSACVSFQQMNTTMAASSSSSVLAPAISSQLSKQKPNVFFNFRGVDTRKEYVNILYWDCRGKGIHPYLDEKSIPRGEQIDPSLFKAIDEADIAVVVFSKNYASSANPLKELVRIMERHDAGWLKVFPIFHKVDPATVRYQTGLRYKLAFFKHMLMRNKKKVQSWRKALFDACKIGGWDTKLIANGCVGDGIQIIADTVFAELHPCISVVNNDLIGIEARMQPLILSLKVGLGGVRMFGIWGEGGGGKTALASSVYDEICSKFDCYWFVKNVRQESSKIDGLVKLQENMLSGLLKQNHVRPRSIEEGKYMIMNKLRNEKVFVVLDDVDRLDQLQALAGSENWFGKGSRIIIITRQQHLLVTHGVATIHDLCLLKESEAIHLLRKYAPQNGRPLEYYELFLKGFVSYTNKLPLVVKLFGSFLCDKDIYEWRSVLGALQKVPDANILEKMKICFDGLEDMEKRLFLDIARFFRNEHTQEGVMMMLEDWGENHVRCIKVLIEKDFIWISDGNFGMHNLVQEMAHYINREEHHKNPHKHGGVLIMEDDLDIFATKDAMKVAKRDNASCSSSLPVNQRLSEVVQRKLWDAYKADDSDTLLPQINEIDDYQKNVALGKHKRLEKGKEKVDMGVSEDRMASMLENKFGEMMENKIGEMMENKLGEMLENTIGKMMDKKMGEMAVKMMETTFTDLFVDPHNKVEQGNPTPP